jgi:hypothetical protein
MRLYELQPFKKHPAFQAAQAQGAYEIGTYRAVRDKLTAEMDRLGWTRAGTGLYAQVYSNPKFNYVIKIFDADNQEYVRYMSWVLQHQNNPFVPRLYGRVRRIGEHAYAVRMERLEHIYSLSIYGQYLGPDVELHDEDPAWQEVLDRDNRPYLKQHWPQLAQVADYLDHYDLDFFNKFTDNIMRRGDTIVFTDPVTG